jgi:hypothetical protein
LLLETAHGFTGDRHQFHSLQRPRAQVESIRPERIEASRLVLHDQPGLDQADEVHARLARRHATGFGDAFQGNRRVGVGDRLQQPKAQ